MAVIEDPPVSFQERLEAARGGWPVNYVEPVSEENLSAARRLRDENIAAPVPENVKEYMRNAPAFDEGETTGDPLSFEGGIPPEDQNDEAAGAPNIPREFEDI